MILKIKKKNHKRPAEQQEARHESQVKKSQNSADDTPLQYHMELMQNNKEITTINFQDDQDDSYLVDHNDNNVHDGDNDGGDNDDDDDVNNQSNLNKKKVRETAMVVGFIKREVENVLKKIKWFHLQRFLSAKVYTSKVSTY